MGGFSPGCSDSSSFVWNWRSKGATMIEKSLLVGRRYVDPFSQPNFCRLPQIKISFSLGSRAICTKISSDLPRSAVGQGWGRAGEANFLVARSFRRQQKANNKNNATTSLEFWPYIHCFSFSNHCFNVFRFLIFWFSANSKNSKPKMFYIKDGNKIKFIHLPSFFIVVFSLRWIRW